MSDETSEIKHEIVIVRRRGADDGAAGKGGAWKIAYADFVTAMMAFFLVMWLINASNEETRAQVASYFNPIKLTDSSTGSRGLKDKKERKNTQGGEGEATAGGTPPTASDARHESEVMSDPDKLLSGIESHLRDENAATGVEGSAIKEEFGSSEPEQKADGVGDPFDPRAWESVPPAPPGESPQLAARKQAEETTSKTYSEEPAPRPEVKFEPKTETPPATSAAPMKEAEAPSQMKTPDGATSASSTAKLTEVNANAISLAAEIARRLGTGLDELPASIDVKSTDEGMLISLTDRQSFGMFKTGSAEPQPELVRLVEAIAGVLVRRPGYVVVRGHTDARPYRNKKYDNWQLSTARAHLAQYMLVRAGLDESRIRRVEGLADREPKISNDPQAPENRRIEILLGQIDR
jgi:chemotaxis protein MotB